MPKPKQFLKEPKKKSKHVPKEPETADDFLAAGVDFEEAGEKWRGGDSKKSARFFGRAIDAYEQGLKKWPKSFDLAYNKARVQYEITQYPKLVAELPGPLLDLLRVALDSSRAALQLDPENADLLFNTGQLLTSLVETMTEQKASSRADNEDYPAMLEEAVELFWKCMAIQEQSNLEAERRPEAQMQDDQPQEAAGEALEAATASDSRTVQDEQWAAIVEPVTNETVLDTILALLETLTLFCGLLGDGTWGRLGPIEKYAVTLLDEKLRLYFKGTEQAAEVSRKKANFLCAFADAKFRNRQLEPATYEQTVEQAFSAPDISNSDPETLCDKATALVNLESGFRVMIPDERLESRWKALTAALESLGAASKLPSTDSPPKIQVLRGDVELLRFQLGSQSGFEVATRNRGLLLKNAMTYYRNAGSLSRASGNSQLAMEAGVKETVISALGEARNQEAIKSVPSKVIWNVAEEMVEEGLITWQWWDEQLLPILPV